MIDRRTFLQATGTTAAATMLAGSGTAAGSGAPRRTAADNEGKESVMGHDAARPMREVLDGYVQRGELPGAVSLVSRRGEVHVDAVGTQAFGGNVAMRRDSIFRIASLTKPIAAVAAMILVEECTLRLDDPVDPWLPELAQRRVLRTLESALDDTVPAVRPITLRDLLTLRAGIGYVLAMPGTYPIQDAMQAAGVAPGPGILDVAPDEAMRRFGSLPLVRQPGEGWQYHSAADILGVLIARASGGTLADFMRQRIFDPLGMVDTDFSVPASKLDRLTTLYAGGPEGLGVYDDARGGRFAQPPVFESAGGGLVSTADDLHAFFAMLLDHGAHGTGRILSRASVELMTANQLTPEQIDAGRMILGEGSGWGFGMAVNTERIDLASNPGRFGWNGGYGTSAYADPKEQRIGVLLTQRMMESAAAPPVFQDFWTIASTGGV